MRSPYCAETIEYVRANGCPTEYLYEFNDDESGGAESSNGGDIDADE